jgi:hypothetical protein
MHAGAGGWGERAGAARRRLDSMIVPRCCGERVCGGATVHQGFCAAVTGCLLVVVHEQWLAMQLRRKRTGRQCARRGTTRVRLETDGGVWRPHRTLLSLFVCIALVNTKPHPHRGFQLR